MKDNVIEEETGFLQNIAKELFGTENRSLEEIYRERVIIQHQSIFCALRDLYIVTNQEYHDQKNRSVMNEWFSVSAIEGAPTLSEINDLRINSENDIKAWSPYIRILALSEWHSEHGENQNIADCFNTFLSFEKTANAIIRDEWTPEFIAEKPITFGLALLSILNSLLSLEKWEMELYRLLTKIDNDVRIFFFTSQNRYLQLRREIGQEKSRIIDREKTKATNSKRRDTSAVTINKRHQGLLDLIKKEAAKGKFRNLSQPRVTTLAKAIVLRVGAYNEDLEPENAISPADNQGIKSILIKRFGFRAQKDLPHNYIDILMS